MSTSLLLPEGVVPSNLHLPLGARAQFVEGDVYDIARRLQELSPRLHVWSIWRNDQSCFAINEQCDDGTERLIFKVGPGFEIDALDARVVEKCRYLMAVPFKERYAQVERDNAAWEAAKREVEHEDLYERLGRPMWTQLEHDGFIQRPVSYPKAGPATRGKRRR